MKSFFSALFLALSLTSLHAQAFPYQFDWWIDTYVPLSNSAELDVEATLQNGVLLPLGFSFSFDDQIHDTLYYAGGSAILTSQDFIIGEEKVEFALFLYNMGGSFYFRPDTKIRHITEGEEPNRIFKLECYHIGIFDQPNSRVDFQVWLYETRNVIQYRIGEQIILDPSVFYYGVAPLIGFIDDLFINEASPLIDYSQWVVGNIQSPVDTVVWGYSNEEAPPFYCDALPQNGSVFTFTPGDVLSAPDHTGSLSALINPNPAERSGRVRLSFPDAAADLAVRVFDVNGRLISQHAASKQSGMIEMNVPNTPGVYYVQARSGTTLYSQKLMVQ